MFDSGIQTEAGLLLGTRSLEVAVVVEVCFTIHESLIFGTNKYFMFSGELFRYYWQAELIVKSLPVILGRWIYRLRLCESITKASNCWSQVVKKSGRNLFAFLRQQQGDFIVSWQKRGRVILYSKNLIDIYLLALMLKNKFTTLFVYKTFRETQ